MSQVIEMSQETQLKPNSSRLKVTQMTDINLSGKRVLIREDLNVPIHEGTITNDARIRASLPTIQAALKAGAQVILMSHLGRPTEGKVDSNLSLAPVAKLLSDLLGRQVPLIQNWTDGFTPKNQDHDLMLLENVRFNTGEKKNDLNLAKKMAKLCDIFVMDAFGTAHRAQASTEGVARFAPQACAGPLLVSELMALGAATESPKTPLLAIVGGAKVSTKLTVLKTLAAQVDELIVGGGIANTFIAALGHNVGNSLHEPGLLQEAKAIMEMTHVPLPTDVVTAKEFSATATPEIKAIHEVADDDMILDIGPNTTHALSKLVKNAGTILWNGPVGVFEIEHFSQGTQHLAQAIGNSNAFSIAGGGDTLAAIELFKVEKNISYISTGGGAFLEFLEGRALPAVKVLEERAQDSQSHTHTLPPNDE